MAAGLRHACAVQDHQTKREQRCNASDQGCDGRFHNVSFSPAIDRPLMERLQKKLPGYKVWPGSSEFPRQIIPPEAEGQFPLAVA